MQQAAVNRADVQLRTLERWRKSQLDSAESEYAALATRVEQQRAMVQQVTQQIGDVQIFARTALSEARTLSPASLLRLTQFAALQAEELMRSKAALAAARAAADAARELVKARFQELAVVEKLRERRTEQMRQAQQRRYQRWLDEHAAGRRVTQY